LSKNARIKYKIRVICDKNYYNSTCTVLCKPRDDQFGHYNCNSKGQKECLEGWSGETCDKPICPEGCVHGTCKSPGKFRNYQPSFWLISKPLSQVFVNVVSATLERVVTNAKLIRDVRMASAPSRGSAIASQIGVEYCAIAVSKKNLQLISLWSQSHRILIITCVNFLSISLALHFKCKHASTE
jgi:hypothetical protein